MKEEKFIYDVKFETYEEALEVAEKCGIPKSNIYHSFRYQLFMTRRQLDKYIEYLK